MTFVLKREQLSKFPTSWKEDQHSEQRKQQEINSFPVPPCPCGEVQRENQEILNNIRHSSLEFNPSYIPYCLYNMLSRKLQRTIDKIDRQATMTSEFRYLGLEIDGSERRELPAFAVRLRLLRCRLSQLPTPK